MRSVANRIKPSYKYEYSSYWRVFGPSYGNYNDTVWHDCCESTMSTGGTNNPSGNLMRIHMTCPRSGVYKLKLNAMGMFSFNSSNPANMYMNIAVNEKNYHGVKSVFGWLEYQETVRNYQSSNYRILLEDEYELVKGNTYNFQIVKLVSVPSYVYYAAFGSSWNVTTNVNNSERKVCQMSLDFIRE